MENQGQQDTKPQETNQDAKSVKSDPGNDTHRIQPIQQYDHDSIPLCLQKCSQHPEYNNTYICTSSECLQFGFICDECIKEQHENHNIMKGSDFIEILRQLVNYDGTIKTYDKAIDLMQARSTSCLMSIIEELDDIKIMFQQKLDQYKYSFDKYRQIISEVNQISEVVYYAYGNDSYNDQFREQLQGILPKLILQDNLIKIASIQSCQNNKLFFPDEELIDNHLAVFQQKIKGTKQQLESELTKPLNYKVLDLIQHLKLQQNKFDEPVTFQQEEGQKIENDNNVMEKFFVDPFDPKAAYRRAKLKSKLKYESTLDDFREGYERNEKIQIVQGHRVLYWDLVYPKFRAKFWTVEPRNACLICKCHPKFARIKEFMHVKYGDLYGPVPCDEQLHKNFRMAVSNRKDQTYLVERAGIYFHDLCLYWSSLVQVDEEKGVVDFDTFHYAVKIAFDTFCFLCKRRGATMKCNNTQCEIWVHYYCWKGLDTNQQFLDTEKFRILCHRHVSSQYKPPVWIYPNNFIEKYGIENCHRAINVKVNNESESVDDNDG